MPKKYRKKPEIVEAEVYRAGMEDGFRPVYVFAHGESEEKEPYIGGTFKCAQTINSGDYILTHADGTRSVMSPEAFHAAYEGVL